MADLMKAYAVSDMAYRLIRASQQLGRLGKPVFRQIFIRGCLHTCLEAPQAFRFADICTRRKPVQRNILAVMLAYVL